MNVRTIALSAATAVLAGCALHGSSTTNLLPQDAARRVPAAASTRGQIISLKRVTVITKKQMMTGVVNGVVTQLAGKPKCDVTLYAVRYDTIGVKGEAADASAAFMVPGKTCGTGPFPLIGYAHGTNIAKNQLITDPSTSNPNWTAPDQNPTTVAAIYAAHGYAVAATDYLGLGESTYPFHPYLHVASEATAVIDALRAIRLAAKSLNVPLRAGTGVFLSGHSQGGQVAVGTQRAIESGAYKGEFSVLVDAASSGPYALSQTFQDAVRSPSQDAPLLAAYTLTGYQKVYGNLYAHPTEIFKNPYAAGIDNLLPVHTYAQANELLGKTLPLKLPALLQPAWAKTFLADAKNPARVAADDNSLLSGWRPIAPIDLCGGKRDPEVEFRNAIKAQLYFQSVHARIGLLRDVDDIIPPSVPFKDYHVTVGLFCLTLMREINFDPVAFPPG
jgi:pimeloyl-ACP methyl ester carboxylesterase